MKLFLCLNILFNMSNSFKNIFNTNPRYSTILGFILGLILIDDLSVDEQNALGDWLMLIAQTIITNANSQNVIESRIKNKTLNINSREVKSIYNPVIYNIDKIKEIVKVLYPNDNINLKDLSDYIESIKSKIDKIKVD